MQQKTFVVTISCDDDVKMPSGDDIRNAFYLGQEFPNISRRMLNVYEATPEREFALDDLELTATYPIPTEYIARAIYTHDQNERFRVVSRPVTRGEWNTNWSF